MARVGSYVFRLILASAVGFGIHLGVLHYMEAPLFDHMIVRSYLANTILAVIILVGLMKAPASLQNSLGFLFMAGSLLKFALFFLFFYPAYHADGDVSGREFSTFFVPYAVCLIFETQALISKLSKDS